MPAWDSIDRGSQHLLATFVAADMAAADITMDAINTDGYWLPTAVVVADAGFSGVSGTFDLNAGNDGTNFFNLDNTGTITAAGTTAIELADEVTLPRYLQVFWDTNTTASGSGIFQLYMKRLK